jgi:hypothetical protein
MNRTMCLRKSLLATCALAILPCLLAAQEHTAEKAVPPAPAPGAVESDHEGDALLRATFPGRKGWKRVEQGTVLEGRLSLPLYDGERIVAPADSTVRVNVKSVEKLHENIGFWRKSGRAIVRAFNPLETSHPAEYRVDLSAADLLLPTGEALPLNARALRAGSGVMVEPKSKPSTLSKPVAEKNKSVATLLLAVRPDSLSSIASGPNAVSPSTVGNQRVARAYMLIAMRASVNHAGDQFTAQLAEPMLVAGRMLAPGSVVEGTVVRSVAPRMLSRAGKLSLRVDRIVPHDAEPLRVSGSLSAAEADAQTRFALDEEGMLHGRKPGIANGLVDLGYAYALGKATDDISETPIRAIGASMSNAAVANAARYVGLGSSLAFLITRHGRDVYLPKYAMIEIDLGRVGAAASTAKSD